MNANQIANELENIYWIQGDGKGKPFQQYADFIRQQQAEIEVLRNSHIELERGIVKDLNQRQSSEPVAWIAIGDNTSVFFDLDTALSIDDNPTPLYTHPVELTLTDEEILKLADETCLTAWIAINPIMDIEKQKEIAKQKMIDFAEAILRKAQEK